MGHHDWSGKHFRFGKDRVTVVYDWDLVDEYSAARPLPLTRVEREHVAACATFIAAYTARCEHAHQDGADVTGDPNSFAWALRVHGEDYLRP